MDRHQKAEADWCAKLDALGMSESFELIKRDWSSDHGRRARIKCKVCGAEFYTWNLREIFRGRQDRLICAECGAASDGSNIWERSAECDEAMTYYVAGHTVAETAEKFGVSKARINGSVKTRGLTNGRQWGERSDAHKEAVRKEAEHRLAERINSLGFDYLGGYTNMVQNVVLKCRACGDVFERTAGFVMRGNLICKKCEHEKTLIRQAKQRIIRKAEAERRRAEREAERLLHPPKDRYADLHNDFLDREGICEICGKPYTVREYIESCGAKKAQDNGVCSDKCRRIKTNRQVREYRKRRGVRDSHRHRARKYGCAYDSSVTLAKLIKRDGLRCAICGEMCDLNDHSWSRYSGPMYPSIDHIIPMVKGGGHVWGNVQVAHMICNSEKGANT